MKHKNTKNISPVETGGITNPIGFGTNGRKIKKKIFNKICERANALVTVVLNHPHAVEASTSIFLGQYCEDWPRDRHRMVVQMASLQLLDLANGMLEDLKRGEIGDDIAAALAASDEEDGTSTTMEEKWQYTLDFAGSCAEVVEALNKYNLRLGLTVIEGTARPVVS